MAPSFQHVALLSALALACQKEDPAPTVVTEVAPSPAPVAPAPPAPPPAPEFVASSSALSIASFKGDNMVECSTLNVTTKRKASDPEVKWLTPDQIAIVLTEDFMVARRGGDSLFGRTNEGASLGLAFLDRGEWKARARARAQTKDAGGRVHSEAEIDAALDQLVATAPAWPPKSFAKEVKSGEIAKVDSCDIASRLALGTCSMGQTAPVGSWSWELRHYSVAATVDSDAAFKSCLRMGGKWSAPDPNSSEVAAERIRQHSTQLRDLAEPLRRQ